MSTLPELTTFLSSQSIGLTSATNLFYGFMPPSPDALVVLYEYGGRMSEPHMGGTTINLEFPSVQAAARGIPHDYDGPRALLSAVVGAFAKIGGQVGTLSGVKYEAIVPKQPIFELRRDDNFRVIMVVNFDIMKGYSA